MYSDGRTPLHIACESGSAEMVSLLVRSGADLEAKAEVRTELTSSNLNPLRTVGDHCILLVTEDLLK
jgi:ankyrin repeat protein